MRQLILLLLIAHSGLSQAQPQPDELPFAPAKGVGKIIRIYVPLEAPAAGRPQRSHDTDAVYLLNADGFVHSAYFSGYVGGKHTYAYDSGRLIQKRFYELLKEGETPRPGDEGGYRPTSLRAWEYYGKLVSAARHYHGAGNLLTEEIRYQYDRNGRLLREFRHYPDQKELYYPSHYDSLVYGYRGDSVMQLSYEKRTTDTFYYLKRRNLAGKRTELHQISKDGKHYTHEHWAYDNSGRTTEYRYASDWPVVQRDGTVLRADRVVYTYDGLGRLMEETCYAAGVKRWAHRYVYVT